MNSDIRISTNLVNHPKIKLLNRILGDGSFFSLISLWSYVAINRPKGNISGISKLQLAIASNWDGDEELFFSTLVEIGLLDIDDDIVTIHNWAKHNPYAIDAETRSNKARFSKMKSHYPELYKELHNKGYRSITTNEYQRAVNESLSNRQEVVKVSSTPSPVPAPSPVPEPSLKDITTKKEKKPVSKKFNPQSIRPLFLSEKELNDIMIHRLKHKAKPPETERAYKGIFKQLGLAVDKGFTLQECLTRWLDNSSWQTFKLEYMDNSKSNTQQNQPQPKTMKAKHAAMLLEDMDNADHQ